MESIMSSREKADILSEYGNGENEISANREIDNISQEQSRDKPFHAHPKKSYSKCTKILKRKTGRGPAGKPCSKRCVIKEGLSLCAAHRRKIQTKRGAREQELLRKVEKFEKRIKLAIDLLNVGYRNGREDSVIKAIEGKYDGLFEDVIELDRKIASDIAAYDKARHHQTQRQKRPNHK